jgi:hypothetical protein
MLASCLLFACWAYFLLLSMWRQHKESLQTSTRPYSVTFQKIALIATAVRTSNLTVTQIVKNIYVGILFMSMGI